MEKELLDTIRTLIEQSNHCSRVDAGDEMTDFEPDITETAEIPGAIIDRVIGQLKDGANLIDLYWDIHNWVVTMEVEIDHTEEELMGVFWEAVENTLVKKPTYE